MPTFLTVPAVASWLIVATMPILAAVWIASRRTRLRRQCLRVIVLGPGDVATYLDREISTDATSRCRIVGYVHDGPDPTGARGVPWLGRPGDLAAIVQTHRPAEIVMARTGPLPDSLEAPLIAARLRGIRIEDAWQFHERLTGKVAIEAVDAGAMVLADGFHHSDFQPSDVYLLVTRVLNVAAALAGLLVLSPLFAAIALAIALDARGPVLFVHSRVGYRGRPFRLYKFRTMAPAVTPRSEWVRDNGDRITVVGRWLRRMRLDELPQLVNVLRGEMNLVGPRPHPTSNFGLFFHRIPYYSLRTAVRPGITGWAQVHYGYANSLEEEAEKIRYDLHYIRHRSIALDFRILLATVVLLVSRPGSSDSVRHPAPSPFRASRGGGTMAGIRIRIV